MYNICIVGAGVTGLSLLLLLQESKADMSKVCIIDPHFDGGDLARKWTTVQSNTPWSKTTSALLKAFPSLQLTTMSSTTTLIEIAGLLQELTAPILKKVGYIPGMVTRANYSTGPQWWTIYANVAGKSIEILSTKLILAPGSEPKTLDLPIPSIPLEVALNKQTLQHYIKPNQNVMVFGTLHSGTIVIRNLVACGANVSAYYHSVKPFYWDRDGAYDGIKEEAAQIADEIMAGKIPVDLIPVQDTAKVIRGAAAATWVVYAMGFAPRNTIQISVDAIINDSRAYNGTTGLFDTLPCAWGFGIAYPNLAPDSIHWDVSVAAFLEHMGKQIPDILKV